MTVDVELFGQLGINRERNQSLELVELMTIDQVAELIGIPAQEIGLATIDGVQVPLNTLVPKTCRLSLFAPMTGG